MIFEEKNPPRTFQVGKEASIEISDCGELHLAPNEQITFVTSSGRRHDFAAKDWGFYATPSLNGRLKDEGFKTALVRNAQGRHYILVVEEGFLGAFFDYLKSEDQCLVEWLDERT
jgi:hypothetical protein